jgi:hypothetical protein
MEIAALKASASVTAAPARRGEQGAAAREEPRVPQEQRYLSPVFKYDSKARVVLFQFRDSDTGDVTRQYPSEKVVKLYQNGAAKADRTPEPERAAEAESSSGNEERSESTETVRLTA